MTATVTETVLHFLRSQIAEHRRVARLERGALQFVITQEKEGTTDYWSLYINPKDVVLEHHALPLEQEEPIVTLFCSDLDLARVSRGESPTAMEVEGDRALFEAITVCFRPNSNLIGVRLP